MIVTLTTPEEASILAARQREAFRPLYERYHDERNPYLRGAEDIANRLNRPSVRYFTIRQSGEIVGGLFFSTYDGTGDIRAADAVYLNRIYIDPRYQRQGVGQAAVRAGLASFPRVKRCLVDFPADLEKNRRFYESLDFRDTGRRQSGVPELAFYEKTLEEIL